MAMRVRRLLSDVIYALRRRGRDCTHACSEMHTFEKGCELWIKR